MTDLVILIKKTLDNQCQGFLIVMLFVTKEFLFFLVLSQYFQKEL
jgi:hypothetical protein